MTDVTVPVYRSLTEAARRIPSLRKGKSAHPATLTRWIMLGVQLQDGSRLKLQGKRFPGGWAVSDEDLDTFVNALTQDRQGEPVAIDAPQIPAARRRAIEAAEHELDRVGI